MIGNSRDYGGVPMKILMEFKKRWSNTDRASIGDFLVAIHESKNKDEMSRNLVDLKYNHYMEGWDRDYPEGLKTYPQPVLKQVIEECNDMIKF